MISLLINPVCLAHVLGTFLVSIYRLDPAPGVGSSPVYSLFSLYPLVSPSPPAVLYLPSLSPPQTFPSHLSMRLSQVSSLPIVSL